jgi:hypothetical protein
MPVVCEVDVATLELTNDTNMELVEARCIQSFLIRTLLSELMLHHVLMLVTGCEICTSRQRAVVRPEL